MDTLLFAELVQTAMLLFRVLWVFPCAALAPRAIPLGAAPAQALLAPAHMLAIMADGGYTKLAWHECQWAGGFCSKFRGATSK